VNTGMTKRLLRALRALSFLVAIAACHAAAIVPAPPLGAAPAATASAGDLVMTQAELDARIADGRLAPVELPQVAWDEVHGFGPPPAPRLVPPANEVWLTECVPSNAFHRMFKTPDGGVYVQFVEGGGFTPARAPAGEHSEAGGPAPFVPTGGAMATPSTHCFDARYAVPAGMHKSGEIKLTR
jgi:hypothetical protein